MHLKPLAVTSVSSSQMTEGVEMAMSRTLMFAVLALLIAGVSPAVDSDAVARANAQIAKGDAALKKSDFNDAEKRYRKAVEMAPEVPSAHLGLGASQVGQRRYEEDQVHEPTYLTSVAETPIELVMHEPR